MGQTLRGVSGGEEVSPPLPAELCIELAERLPVIRVRHCLRELHGQALPVGVVIYICIAQLKLLVTQKMQGVYFSPVIW